MANIPQVKKSETNAEIKVGDPTRKTCPVKEDVVSCISESRQ
jgi:hypothetical protein